MTKRVVITGAGIVSRIGNDLATVETSLREGRSGIKAMPKFTELGMRSQVAGIPEIDVEARIDRKQLRFMGDAAAYAQIALEDAIAQAGLPPEMVSHPRTGLIMGSGGGSPANQIEAADTLREKGIRRVGPYQVTRCMSFNGIGLSCDQFQGQGHQLLHHFGMLDIGALHWRCGPANRLGHAGRDVCRRRRRAVVGMSLLFDGMGAMSSKYNATPEKAPRAYDAHRDGFVIAGGGGAVVLESLEHALARGAHILGEAVGFGATSDGEDMVAPSGDGAVACMKQAMETVNAPIDYINTHGTSTPVGDMQKCVPCRPCSVTRYRLSHRPSR